MINVSFIEMEKKLKHGDKISLEFR